MLDRFHKIAEIVASLAIVGSLIFVGIQIDQNTTAVLSQTHRDLVKDETHTSELLVTHGEVATIVIAGEKDPSTLTEVEKARFYQYALHRFATWETAYLAYEQGLLAPRLWDAWILHYSITLNKPGYKLFWKDNIRSFESGFGAVVETILFSIDRPNP